jgi:hypothetical protein
MLILAYLAGFDGELKTTMGHRNGVHPSASQSKSYWNVTTCPIFAQGDCAIAQNLDEPKAHLQIQARFKTLGILRLMVVNFAVRLTKNIMTLIIQIPWPGGKSRPMICLSPIACVHWLEMVC